VVPLTFSHVKGHQDEDHELKDLPYKAQLDVQCDQHASKALETLLVNTCPHPQLPSNSLHLTINGQTIVRQYQEYLCEATQLPQYHQYLTNKFLWHPSIPNQIEWIPIQYALRKFTNPDQTQIQKIIHKWIPTRVSPGNSPSHKPD